MSYRKLRIAWSVTWGVLALLLVVLWVRSYQRTEFVERTVDVDRLYASGVEEQIINRPGSVEFIRESVVNNSRVSDALPGWKYRAYDGVAPRYTARYAKSRAASPYSVILIPHVAAVLVLGTAAGVPWIRWSKRFSLRTLLVATTLVGMMLGVVVYLARR